MKSEMNFKVGDWVKYIEHGGTKLNWIRKISEITPGDGKFERTTIDFENEPKSLWNPEYWELVKKERFHK